MQTLKERLTSKKEQLEKKMRRNVSASSARQSLVRYFHETAKKEGYPTFSHQKDFTLMTKFLEAYSRDDLMALFEHAAESKPQTLSLAGVYEHHQEIWQSLQNKYQRQQQEAEQMQRDRDADRRINTPGNLEEKFWKSLPPIFREKTKGLVGE